MGPHEIFDLQTAGIKIVKQRQKIRRLETENTDLRIQIDGYKMLIEEILLAPGTYDYFTGNHPMQKDRPE